MKDCEFANRLVLSDRSIDIDSDHHRYAADPDHVGTPHFCRHWPGHPRIALPKRIARAQGIQGQESVFKRERHANMQFSRLEAVNIRLEAIAIRLEAIAITELYLYNTVQ